MPAGVTDSLLQSVQERLTLVRMERDLRLTSIAETCINCEEHPAGAAVDL
jgi:hypothetical protein